MERIFPRLRRLHICADQAMSEQLSQMELTAAQGCAMGYLNHQPAPPLAKDFEEAMHLSHSCALGLLDRLEKKGFIVFQPDPNDKRCKRIVPTEKGGACHDRMHAHMETMEQTIARDFSPEERELFIRLLDRAIANLTKEEP